MNGFLAHKEDPYNALKIDVKQNIISIFSSLFFQGLLSQVGQSQDPGERNISHRALCFPKIAGRNNLAEEP